ncbi:class I SAM-dependent methyltransferase [Variovorax saccharolyticus]|uniref:class I SAM-dependent methyltransferase n=1 Tax=Variovorax saccharolyticus TaxID=3053516 RepID=UPI002577602F|nr:class I SAM-dependent methyltransferase [Variovorax sp. J22R187]MDM0016141.1 class I SAM-dependent methyltransferase [Variovorax sp. J22R187]
MTGFSADWLALREPFDRSARCASAAALDPKALAQGLRGAAPDLGVLDLACGTGANLRELAPRLGGSQRWLLVDHDPLLLAALPDVLRAWAGAQGLAFSADGLRLRIEGPGWLAEVQPLRIDLARGLDQLPLSEVGLVTASALLDLVSAAWLDDLLVRARAAGAALWFALTVVGRVDWTPEAAGDALLARLFEAHQRRDKGFGAALGAAAADRAAERMGALGYRVLRADSDWDIDASLGAPAQALLAALIEGTADAAREQDPEAAAAVAGWAAERRRLLGRTRLRIGHRELLATLPEGS